MTDPLARLIEEWRAKARERLAGRRNWMDVQQWNAETNRAADIDACADELSAILAASSKQQDQEVDTRVDGERRAAGPTGSTAASNGIIPT